MSDGLTMSIASHERRAANGVPLASGAFVAAGISFLAGGLIVTQTEVPPSLSPTLGMLTHALWAIAIAILAVGVAAALRSTEALRAGLAGYLSAGVLGLGVLHALQWVSWAYVDVRAARRAEHELVLETLIVPFGAGHLLVYGILLGTGVTLLGWSIRRAGIAHRYVAWAGVLLGALTLGLWTVSLLFAFGGGGDGHVLFDIATLLLPALYLWAMVLGVDLRRGMSRAPVPTR